MIIKKICKNKFTRVFLLLILVVSINYFFYYSMAPSFYNYLPLKASKLMNAICNNDTNELIVNKDLEFNNIIDKIEDKIENSDIKLFKNFIAFNISIENSIKTKKEEIIKFNIEIDGEYREAISNKGKVFLTRKSINGLKELKLQNLTYSFRPGEISPTNETSTINIIDDDENIKLHIELYWASFFFWFSFISIPISWGVLLLLNSIEKFIISGEPVIYKDKKKKPTP